MKTSIKILMCNLLAVFMLVSCNNSESLQTYFVDNQETPNFISADLPTSIVKLDDLSLSDDQKEAYKSVKRLNFLGYKLSENNAEMYQTEYKKVKNILNDEKYIDLMELNDKAGNIIVKYIGDDDVADELVVFVNYKETGFGVVRILGKDMSPEKMATLVNAMQKADFDESQLNGIMDFFK